MNTIFFLKIIRNVTIPMIYNILSTDKNFQRYFASNIAKNTFLNIWPGKKSLSSNKACDVKLGTEVFLMHKSLLFSCCGRLCKILRYSIFSENVYIWIRFRREFNI